MNSKDRVGKAYRGADGIVRWVTSLSTRGVYSLLWLDEKNNTWWYGGKVRATEWASVDGHEVVAPQPDETYRKYGVFGDQ